MRPGSVSRQERAGRRHRHSGFRDSVMISYGEVRSAVVVIGASGGIGRAIAKVAARERGAVVLVARSPEGLGAAAAEVREAGGEAFNARAGSLWQVIRQRAWMTFYPRMAWCAMSWLTAPALACAARRPHSLLMISSASLTLTYAPSANLPSVFYREWWRAEGAGCSISVPWPVSFLGLTWLCTTPAKVWCVPPQRHFTRSYAAPV